MNSRIRHEEFSHEDDAICSGGFCLLPDKDIRRSTLGLELGGGMLILALSMIVVECSALAWSAFRLWEAGAVEERRLCELRERVVDLPDLAELSVELAEVTAERELSNLLSEAASILQDQDIGDMGKR